MKLVQKHRYWTSICIKWTPRKNLEEPWTNEFNCTFVLPRPEDRIRFLYIKLLKAYDDLSCTYNWTSNVRTHIYHFIMIQSGFPRKKAVFGAIINKEYVWGNQCIVKLILLQTYISRSFKKNSNYIHIKHSVEHVSIFLNNAFIFTQQRIKPTIE